MGRVAGYSMDWGGVVDEVEEALHDAWERESVWAQADDSGVGLALRPVVRGAMQHEVLRRFFPFTSVGRLCFSQCSSFPFTDSPCIQHFRDGVFYVMKTWFVSEERTPFLLVTSELAEALDAAASALSGRGDPWIGNARERPCG